MRQLLMEEKADRDFYVDNSKCIKCRLHCWVCVRHSFNKTVLTITKLIMPYPPTVGILLLTSVSPCFLNHPVISQPLSKLLQGGSVPTVSPRRSPHRCSDETALQLHPKLTHIPSLYYSCRGRHSMPPSGKFCPPLVFRAPATPAISP